MSWVLYVLVAYIIFAFGNVLQKILKTKKIKDAVVFAVISYLVYGAVPLALLFFKRPEFVSLGLILLTVFVGSLSFFAFVFYVKSLEHEEISRIIPLFGFNPMFVLIFSTIFLREILSTENYIAFAIILLGGFLISTRLHEKRIRISKAFYLILASAFIYGVYNTSLKYISGYMDVYSYFQYAMIGMTLTALLFLLSGTIRKKLAKTAKTLGKKSWGVVVFIELSSLFGMFLLYYALKIAPISLISVLGNFQSVFVLVFASLLSHRYPHLIEEEKNRKVLLIKITSIVVMFFGLWLIYAK